MYVLGCGLWGMGCGLWWQCLACQAPGDRVEPSCYTVPTELAPGEVEVQITHCGVCHSDLHQINDAWGAACWPLVPTYLTTYPLPPPPITPSTHTHRLCSCACNR